MNSFRRPAIAFLLCLLASSPSLGAQRQRAGIQIRVIYAVKQASPSIDPALDDIREELKELPFDKFRLLDRIRTEVAKGAEVELQLPGDKAIAVKFLGVDNQDGKKMLRLQLTVKPALRISLRLADGSRTLIGGPGHLEGKLILDVNASLKAGSE
ncbi:MAG: hypothetical protein D6806_17580 [Deltaproteobacteria bacterium]|nr:MAG: hypothetical protein D6806_17580 [Deltaproteobacteria bacterium]